MQRGIVNREKQKSLGSGGRNERSATPPIRGGPTVANKGGDSLGLPRRRRVKVDGLSGATGSSVERQ